jgi:putrescine aminotransferase
VVRRTSGLPADLLPLRVQLIDSEGPTEAATGRRVLLQLLSPSLQQAFEAVISLSGRSVLAFRPLQQTVVADIEAAFALCRQDPRFAQIVQAKHIQPSDLVMVPCAASTTVSGNNTASAGGVRSLFFRRGDLLNTDATKLVNPIDGLFPLVNLQNQKVEFLERFEQPTLDQSQAVQAVSQLQPPQPILRKDAKTVQEHAQHALSIIFKQQLSKAEQEQVMDETLRYWKANVNAGFLKYRKSVADGQGFAALDWSDPYPGSAFFHDHAGNRYLDLLGGFGIYNLGRRHPKVVAAVQAQLNKQALHSQELLDPLRAYCAHLVSLLMPQDDKRKLTHCFFTNSGTESVEACLKVAFLGTGRKTIVACTNAFHGKTLGALSCTSKSAFRKPFVGTMHNTLHVPFNDVKALQQVFASSRFTGNEIAGLILEPIQGEGGIHVSSLEFMRTARSLCDEYGAMLIFDEVQTGMGRTGKMFAAEHFGVCPDVMAIGKAFGGGICPAGACVGTEKSFSQWIENPFLFTTTFGGNPLALSASIATINVLLEEKLCDAARDRGEQFIRGLRRIQAQYPHVIKEVRGVGLMIGIEFQDNDMGVDFSRLMFARRVLVSGTLVNAQTIRIEPPLTITKDQVDYCLSVCEGVANQISNSTFAKGAKPLKSKL